MNDHPNTPSPEAEEALGLFNASSPISDQEPLSESDLIAGRRSNNSSQATTNNGSSLIGIQLVQPPVTSLQAVFNTTYARAITASLASQPAHISSPPASATLQAEEITEPPNQDLYQQPESSPAETGNETVVPSNRTASDLLELVVSPGALTASGWVEDQVIAKLASYSSIVLESEGPGNSTSASEPSMGNVDIGEAGADESFLAQAADFEGKAESDGANSDDRETEATEAEEVKYSTAAEPVSPNQLQETTERVGETSNDGLTRPRAAANSGKSLAQVLQKHGGKGARFSGLHRKELDKDNRNSTSSLSEQSSQASSTSKRRKME